MGVEGGGLVSKAKRILVLFFYSLLLVTQRGSLHCESETWKQLGGGGLENPFKLKKL